MGSKTPWWFDAPRSGEFLDRAMAGLDNDPTSMWHATGVQRDQSTKALMRAYGGTWKWNKAASQPRPTTVDIDMVLQRRPDIGLDGEVAMGRAVRLIPKDRPDLALAALDNACAAIEAVARPLASVSITRAYLQAMAQRHKAAQLRSLRAPVAPKRLGPGLDVDTEGLVVKKQRDGTVVSVYGKDVGTAERDQHVDSIEAEVADAAGTVAKVRQRSIPDQLAKAGAFGRGEDKDRRLRVARAAVAIFERADAAVRMCSGYDITHPGAGDGGLSEEALHAIGRRRRFTRWIDGKRWPEAPCTIGKAWQGIAFSKAAVLAWLVDTTADPFAIDPARPAVGTRRRAMLVDVLDLIVLPSPTRARRAADEDGLAEEVEGIDDLAAPATASPPAADYAFVEVPEIGVGGRAILSLFTGPRVIGDQVDIDLIALDLIGLADAEREIAVRAGGEHAR